MKQEELKKDTWYSCFPYTGSNGDCEWWLKADGERRGGCTKYISWFTTGGSREFKNMLGNIGGKEYREATPKEAAWLAEVEKCGKYFPIEEFKFEEVINHYEIY